MDQISYVGWRVQMSQLERSRLAHQQHERHEHLRAASAARPAAPAWSNRIRGLLTIRVRAAAPSAAPSGS
ncbi:MAG: hypothetical protein MUD13_08625 [Candidatus Nanopelagicales bacterium]|jgi:hypothetical protein|nr:hypothetical protein [Candidatus Nanopelagicales bacterium]